MARVEFFLPTRLISGADSFLCIGDEITKVGRKPLIVSGKNAMRRGGILSAIEKFLSDSDLKAVFFDQAEPEPSSQTMDRGAEIARKVGSDCVVGIGGGSAHGLCERDGRGSRCKDQCVELCQAVSRRSESSPDRGATYNRGYRQ